MYWVYRTKTYMWHNQHIIAETVDPTLLDRLDKNIQSPLQLHPYETEPILTFRINPRHKQPDNYSNGTAFKLYSQRLIELMQESKVRFECFPVTMVDDNNTVQSDLNYYVFHSLEGMQCAMDRQRSNWQGDSRIGVPHIILDYTKFEHRPIFVCADLYVDLMRDDLKQKIERERITGFEFFSPERFGTGHMIP